MTVFAGMTEMERKVTRLLAEGLSNKEIGRKLDIAEATVKVHVRSILRRLHANSRIKVAIRAALEISRDTACI
jgi:two-component system nitrate/nitrite response regulator NarL